MRPLREPGRSAAVVVVAVVVLARLMQRALELELPMMKTSLIQQGTRHSRALRLPVRIQLLLAVSGCRTNRRRVAAIGRA